MSYKRDLTTQTKLLIIKLHYNFKFILGKIEEGKYISRVNQLFISNINEQQRATRYL